MLGMCLYCDEVIDGVIVLIEYRYLGMSTAEWLILMAEVW